MHVSAAEAHELTRALADLRELWERLVADYRGEHLALRARDFARGATRGLRCQSLPF